MKILITLCVVFLQVLLATAVLKRDRKSRTNQLISFFIFNITLWTVTNLISVLVVSAQEKLFWVRVVMAASTPLPTLFFFLAKVFPRKKAKLSKKIVLFAGSTNLILIWLATTEHMFAEVALKNGSFSLVPGPAVLLYGLSFMIFAGSAFLELLQKSKRSQGVQRVQARYILLGVTLTVVFGFTTNFLVVVVLRSLDAVLVGPVASLFLIFSLYYVIVKHRFLDIHLFITRSSAMSIAVFLLASLQVFVLNFFDNVFTENQASVEMFLKVLFGVAVLTASPKVIKKILQSTEKLFYTRQFYVSEALLSLQEILRSTILLDELKQRISDEVKKILVVEKVFFTFSKKQKRLEIRGHATETQSNVLIVREMSRSLSKKSFRKSRLEIVVPLVAQNQVIGQLCIGQKISRESFSLEELKYISLISTQVALACKNALLYEKVTQFNTELGHRVTLATRKLQSQNEKLKELDVLKDEFVAVASHQLRTPMTIIKNSLWLSLHQPAESSDSSQKYIQLAYDSSERLIALVKDILTISKIQGKNFRLHKSYFSLEKLLVRIRSDFELKLIEKKIQVELQFKDVIENFLGDESKIREAIQNIFDNAIQYSSLGSSITVTVQKNTNAVLLEIADTGKGMNSQQQRKLFQKFSRTESSYSHLAESGTGLGLYISQKIIHSHGGKIHVHSELHKGSKFTILLPVS